MKVLKVIGIIVIVIVWVLIVVRDEEIKNSKRNLLESKPSPSDELRKTVNIKTDGEFKVHYLDVGQADAVLVENAGKYVLIDAGNRADGDLLVEYFKSIGIEKFDYVVATHAHEDHIGGMKDIIDNFSIDTFYMPDAVTTTKTFEDMLTALEDNNVSVSIPEVGQILLFGTSRFEVIYVGDEKNDLNDTSIVLRALFGDSSFLFTGDATSKVEEQILNKSIESNVLKVGHHGSLYSSTVSFLNKVKPQYAIISVGVGNTYKHPGEETLKRLAAIEAKIYRTDEDGTIVASSDGKNITITTSELCLNG